MDKLTVRQNQLLKKFEEILPISTRKLGDEEVNAIDARTLWKGLRSKQEFAHWIKAKILENELYCQDVDYAPLVKINKREWQPGFNRKDYVLTIKTAKKVAMSEQTKIGNLVREYFLLCEQIAQSYNMEDLIEKFNLPDFTNPVEAARAWADQLEARQKLEAQAKIDKPKVEYHDAVLATTSTYTTTQIAKEFGMSAKVMNKRLQRAGIQFKQSEQWHLTAKYQEEGYTQVRTHLVDEQTTHHNTVWTEKGRKFLYDFINGRLIRDSKRTRI